MKKEHREQFVIDEFTKQLIALMLKKAKEQGSKVSKGELYRRAIYTMAKDQLTETEITDLIKAIKDMDNI